MFVAASLLAAVLVAGYALATAHLLRAGLDPSGVYPSLYDEGDTNYPSLFFGVAWLLMGVTAAASFVARFWAKVDNSGGPLVC